MGWCMGMEDTSIAVIMASWAYCSNNQPAILAAIQYSQGISIPTLELVEQHFLHPIMAGLTGISTYKLLNVLSVACLSVWYLDVAKFWSKRVDGVA